MGDDESKFRDAVRGLVKVQQINVETGEQRTARDRLLEMIGGGEGDVATLRAENTQLKTELTAKDEAHQEEIFVDSKIGKGTEFSFTLQKPKTSSTKIEI